MSTCGSGISRISEELPFIDPNYRRPARVAKPGLHVWTLRKGDRVLRCEIRDDSRAGAGWDLQLFDRDGLMTSSRRPTEMNARDAEEYVRNVHLRHGWMEAESARDILDRALDLVWTVEAPDLRVPEAWLAHWKAAEVVSGRPVPETRDYP